MILDIINLFFFFFNPFEPLHTWHLFSDCMGYLVGLYFSPLNKHLMVYCFRHFCRVLIHRYLLHFHF